MKLEDITTCKIIGQCCWKHKNVMLSLAQGRAPPFPPILGGGKFGEKKKKNCALY